MNRRAKGHAFERWIERALHALGIWATRTPSAHDKGIDLHAEIGGELYTFQAWVDGDGFSEIYRRLEPVDFAVYHADHRAKLVTMRWNMFELLLKAALWHQSQPQGGIKPGFSATQANGTTFGEV